jgi:hypothetical protein
MARLVQAVAKYGPRVIRDSTVELDALARWMAHGTNISAGQITMLLMELHDAIVTFNAGGQAVKLPGLGTFGTSVDRHGRLAVTFYTDPQLRRKLNARGTGGLVIQNRRNIGLDDAGYKALWDAEHPDDPVELT